MKEACVSEKIKWARCLEIAVFCMGFPIREDGVLILLLRTAVFKPKLRNVQFFWWLSENWMHTWTQRRNFLQKFGWFRCHYLVVRGETEYSFNKGTLKILDKFDFQLRGVRDFWIPLGYITWPLTRRLLATLNQFPTYHHLGLISLLVLWTEFSPKSVERLWRYLTTRHVNWVAIFLAPSQA